MTPTTTPVRLNLWLDHDEAVRQLPGISAGTLYAPEPGEPGPTAADLAADVYRRGVRRVRLEQPVDVSGEGDGDARSLVSALLLVAELTSWGIAVDWEVRLGSTPELWHSLNHLYPPEAVLDDDGEVAADWRKTFYVSKCIYRRGPGFIQVRDRRSPGTLARFTLDDPDYLRAVDSLVPGCPADDVPEPVLDALVAESLAGRAGELAWWLPYRVRRWPSPSFVV